MQYKDFLQDQQLLQWRFYLNNRRRLAGADVAGVGEIEDAEEGEEEEGEGVVNQAGGTWSNALNEPPVPPPAEVVEPAAGGGGAAAGAGAATKAKPARK